MRKSIPVLILLAAAAITAALVVLKPEPAEVAPERPVTQVEVVTVEPAAITLSVDSQGTVLPRTETDLVVEVAGRIVEMADDFRAGGRIDADELLFRIEAADYEAAAAARAAELAEAELALAEERARAEQARADWEAMGEGEASALTLRRPQLARAEARVAAARAALAKAERDLRRTEVRAPYDGRVLSKQVDLGGYVVANPSIPVARVYATEAAEIRLPLTEREAGFIEPDATPPPLVRIHGDDPSETTAREGRLDRIEATLDTRSRLLYAVAVVDRPFEATAEAGALRRGQFVRARIEGRRVDGAFALPRHALRGSDTVYVLTSENTLRTRKVGILNSDAERVVVTDGLAAGERVVLSPIAYFVENMPAEAVESR